MGELSTPSTMTHDHSDPASLDCWELIFQLLDERSDRRSLINAFPALTERLKFKIAALLLPLVVPILMEKDEVTEATVLLLRTISAPVKEAVDGALVQQQPILFRQHYDFNDANAPERFMNFAQTLNGNPFLTRSCFLRATNRQCVLAAVRLFRAKGEHLRGLEVRYPTMFHTRRILLSLKEVLHHLSKLEWLEISADIRVEQIDAFGGMQVPVGNISPLPHLKRMELRLNCEDGRYLSQFPILMPLLAAYGAHLQEFVCFSYAFLAGLPVSTLSRLIPNLQSLKVDLLDLSSSQVFQQLSSVKWPKLKKLELLRKCDVNAEPIVLSTETLAAVHNFRDSLEELYLETVSEQHVEVRPFFLNDKFLRMKKLSVCTSNVRDPTKMWQLFQANFPNLKSLHFICGVGQQDQDIPDNINSFFHMFPVLQQISWKKDDSPWDTCVVLQRRDN